MIPPLLYREQKVSLVRSGEKRVIPHSLSLQITATHRKEAGLTLTAGCPVIELHLVLFRSKGRVTGLC
jgi:hypothetical protein